MQLGPSATALAQPLAAAAVVPPVLGSGNVARAVGGEATPMIPFPVVGLRLSLQTNEFLRIVLDLDT